MPIDLQPRGHVSAGILGLKDPVTSQTAYQATDPGFHESDNSTALERSAEIAAFANFGLQQDDDFLMQRHSQFPLSGGNSVRLKSESNDGSAFLITVFLQSLWYQAQDQ